MQYRRSLSGNGICRQSTISFLLLFFCSSAHAELLLTAPPRESTEAAQKQYGPLAEYLTEVLGEKVTYQKPKGWMFYQRDIRADNYDIIFDGPHFISWRIKQFDHEVVAKLPGKLGFVLVTGKDSKDTHGKRIKSLDDLINQPVCGIAPPNLATLTVLAEYKNPVSLPKLISAKGGAPGVYKVFKSGKCKAAILRDKFFAKKIPEEEREKLKVLYKSIPVSNQGITVSSRVSAEQREKIIAALTVINPGTAPTLKRFAPKAEKMIPANNAEYEAHSGLLTGIIFGWEITNQNYLDKIAAKTKKK